MPEAKRRVLAHVHMFLNSVAGFDAQRCIFAAEKDNGFRFLLLTAYHVNTVAEEVRTFGRLRPEFLSVFQDLIYAAAHGDIVYSLNFVRGLPAIVTVGKCAVQLTTTRFGIR